MSSEIDTLSQGGIQLQIFRISGRIAIAQSPLTFSILCLTYQDKAITDIKLGNGIKTHLQQLFNAYIMRMFQRPGKLTVDQYSRTQTLLRKVGGGYIFVHRLLMEHFASLTEEDIKRLAGSSDGR